MKIKTDQAWVTGRIGFVILSLLCFIAGPFPALALMIITFQRTFHEFVHAATVYFLGGKIYEISLGDKSYVDFNVPRGERIVFLSGFIFETVCVLIAAFLLFLAGGFFAGIGLGVLAITLYYTVVPKESDFNQWRTNPNV